MSGPDLSQKLLGAGASAQNDWASASAATSLDFTAKAEFNRGFNVAIGLEALATADAGLSKFISATVRGNAFAEAEASLQLQLPLNLFKEFGLAVGAQAKAQAAAGIEVDLGLTLGDFIALVRRDPDAVGLPLELFLLFLEEVTLGGKVEVHVAAAAMAYASLRITGRIIANATQPAGFEWVADAGLGLAAGVGFSGGTFAKFKDFRRYLGRAVDLCVDETAVAASGILPAQINVRKVLGAFAPIAKIALRSCYELGDYIAKNNPNYSSANAKSIANHCVGIVLEESQRFLLQSFIEAGIQAAKSALETDVRGLTQTAWRKLKPEREALADLLSAMAAEPFQPTPENAKYWRDLAATGLSLVAALPKSGNSDLSRSLVSAYCAAEILLEMFRSRVNSAQAYVVVAGTQMATTAPFGGPLPTQPAVAIRRVVNGIVGHASNSNLDYADLLQFLVQGPLLDALRGAVPGVAGFTSIFEGAVAPQANDVIRLLLTNREAFLPDATGTINPKHTLSVLLTALDTFVVNKIQAELRQQFFSANPDPTTKLFFDEVLLSAISFTKDIAFRTALNWETAKVDKNAFTEALASVLTMVLGRSVVIFGDTFFNAVLAGMKDFSAHAASKLNRAKLFSAIGTASSPEMKALLAETIRIGGEVFGPLPDKTRANIREILYELMEPLPPAAQADFLAQLGDQFFVPDLDHLNELKDELLALSCERFGLFVEKVLMAAGQMLLDAIVDFIEEAIKVIQQWERDIARAISDLGKEIAKLGQEIAQLGDQVELAFQKATDSIEDLLESLASGSTRSKFKALIVDEVYYEAKSVLKKIDLYKNLPSEVKGFVKDALYATVQTLVNNPIVDPVLEAIGGVAGALDDIIDDVRGLDPSGSLAAQVLELVVGRIEDGVRDVFGSHPRINVGFSFAYEFFGSHTVSFSLGKVDLPFSTLFDLLRDAIAAVSAVDAGVNQAASDLASAFTKQFQLEEKHSTRAQASTDHERLSVIDGEHTETPKQVVILCPASNSVHSNDVRVEVHLAGVPTSYLGLNADEQQRVFFFLNGNEISPKELVLGRSSSGSIPDLRKQNVDISKLSAFDARSNTYRNNDIKLVVHAGKADTGAHNGGPVKYTGFTKAAFGVNRNVQKGRGKSPGATTFEFSGFQPGRLMTNSGVSELRRALAPGTEVSFTLSHNELIQGANTFTVVLIDRGGRQYQQIVSFGVTAKEKRPRGKKPFVVLPTADGKKKSGPPIRPTVGLSAPSKALQGSFKKAATAMRKESEMNLSRFRPARTKP